jgi:hypothetical protein
VPANLFVICFKKEAIKLVFTEILCIIANQEHLRPLRLPEGTSGQPVW